MEKCITVITTQDAIKRIASGDRNNLGKIVHNGRHENHYLILQYSDSYPLGFLYPPDIRASVDGNRVFAQKVEDLPRNVYK